MKLLRSEARKATAAATSSYTPSASSPTSPLVGPGLLARYVTALGYGMAVQAASGVGRDELQAQGDVALRSWPPS